MFNLKLMANDFSTPITAIATLALAVITAYYVYLTHKILKQSDEYQKMSFNKSRLENYYYPLLSFFDMCDTDECYNCDPNDPPHIINFDSELMDIFNNVFKYQYLAFSEIKSKMPDFVVMLQNKHPDEDENAKYLLFNRLMGPNSEIRTIKNESDIDLFVEVRKLVVDDMHKLDKKINSLVK